MVLVSDHVKIIYIRTENAKICRKKIINFTGQSTVLCFCLYCHIKNYLRITFRSGSFQRSILGIIFGLEIILGSLQHPFQVNPSHSLLRVPSPPSHRCHIVILQPAKPGYIITIVIIKLIMFYSMFTGLEYNK